MRSSPLPKEGRCRAGGAPGRGARHVAILAPPEGGALHLSRHDLIPDAQVVAILAPPEGGALLLVRPAAERRAGVAILAPPEGGALPLIGAIIFALCLMLRSSPLPKEGRCLQAHPELGSFLVAILAPPEGGALPHLARPKRLAARLLAPRLWTRNPLAGST